VMVLLEFLLHAGVELLDVLQRFEEVGLWGTVSSLAIVLRESLEELVVLAADGEQGSQRLPSLLPACLQRLSVHR
jgi:high-affinity Fe2+/Pb2+ permease